MNILPDLNATRILVVEDNLSAADHIVEVLRGAGYSVQNAYNHGDAFAADHSRFTLAVVNGEMRDRNGTSILENIAQHSAFKRLPILVIADNGVPASDPVLRRPFEDSDLLAHVAQIAGAQLKRATATLAKPPTAPLSKDDIPTEPMRAVLDAHLQQQLAELKTLSNLARSISSVLELGEVLNEIVEAATTLTHAEEGLLLLPDDEGKALFLRAMKGVDDDSARNFRIKIEDPLVGRVYSSGAPVLIGDQGLQRVKTEYFVKSLVYVPMTYKGQIVGVLGVNNRTVERVFTHHDTELLLNLAAHAAIAIENARLYEERLQQNRQLTLLVESARAVNATLALSDVLSSVCQQVITTLEVNGCQISQYDKETDALYPLAGARRVIRRPDPRFTLALDERPVLKKALEQNAFYSVKRSVADANWRLERQYLDRDGVEQMIVLPIRPGQQPAIGVLELFYLDVGPEVTSEFRAKLRSVALEMLAMIADRSGPLSTAYLLSNARRILDEATANWMRLSIIQEKRQLASVVDYGSAVFLNPTFQPRLAFPDSMLMFADQSPVQHHVREANLPDPARAMLKGYGAEALMSLPLMIKGASFGAVTIYNAQESRYFRPNEISLAWALVTQAATAIENANLYNHLEQSLSELRQAQAQLVQAARLSTMGELAAVVAHQINNPLTTIMGDAELILQEMEETNPWHDGVKAIYRAGRRAHNVVKRLLSTARRGNPGEAPQRIDVHETIYNTLELVTTHIERSNISFDVSLDEARKVYVYAAPGHLEDLWLNLLLNARDALINVPDAFITIRSRFGEEILEIAVCDNGSGIPQEHVEHIFDPFFTTKPPGEGTGLGLYICKQILSQCGGTIRVEVVENAGTCFLVTLPVET